MNVHFEIKSKVKALVRPFIRILGIDKQGNYSPSDNWCGNFLNWDAAMSSSIGYCDKTILEKCKNSLLKVKNGEAVYERDSVLFDKIQYAWPLLACLENVALKNNNEICLIDFGGSLGSSFFQNRDFLSPISIVKWIVVEQKHFVDCGKKEFENEVLKFNYSVEEALLENTVHCLLLSSVLQYLPNPFEWIEQLLQYNIKNIIIDRTGFTNAQNHRITVQNVPPDIYDASYPCWFFNENELMKTFLTKYKIITDFEDCVTPPISVDGEKCFWKGFYLQLRQDGE
jgi:putative methyltransferase (TIGR04325 family)